MRYSIVYLFHPVRYMTCGRWRDSEFEDAQGEPMGYFGMARAEASDFRDSTILDGNVMAANFNQYSISIFFVCSFEVR
jgi:hypothetical protein